ncbi:MAG: tRNA methyltransferase ppm2 [Cirrosporium novae-zelandiae]|nr:MAG: tRNA methyltransferase ppm2 [Cirrosporium novae-zelandiae]KAI9735549.1 MAG: tRNA methyltransferase ppm2 [Cirrosporium novae-zelandiae]
MNSKKAQQDASIMGTNNSSIVSKRAVERLYYPEPHFFRYFVKKPQRRSPLINRGYWLRMQAVEHAVCQFLQVPTDKTKVVINLGDPLPFHFLSKHSNICDNAIFIDVDYPDLIKKKYDMLSQTSPLQQSLTGIDLNPNTEHVTFKSDQYVAIACDLRELEKLESTLERAIDLPNSWLYFTAEVSVTYMDIDAANNLFKWASKFQNAKFCLLEQFLPDGPENPFSKTMLKHFEKIQTPLKSVYTYMSLEDHRQRFLEAGWRSASIQNLWDLWQDESFLTAKQRTDLDQVEPFDEWEEFALFASHYFLLLAENIDHPLEANPSVEQLLSLSTIRINSSYRENPKLLGRRRYGAAIPFSSDLVGLHGGFGLKTRMNSIDFYTLSDKNTKPPRLNPSYIHPRMCHTIASLDNRFSLLVGGRESPEKAFADCWLYNGNAWSRVDDLPVGRYRHSAIAIRKSDGSPAVLVGGGKDSSGQILDDWLLWSASKGWEVLDVTGSKPTPRFGASMAIVGQHSGILTGGITKNGIVCPKHNIWNISWDGDRSSIHFSNFSLGLNESNAYENVISRFGSMLAWSRWGLLLVGGIGIHGVLTKDVEIICIDKGRLIESISEPSKSLPDVAIYQCVGAFEKRCRPLLIGHSISTSNLDAVQVLGGGAVCFSFGCSWNEGTWTLTDDQADSGKSWTLVSPEPTITSTDEDHPVQGLDTASTAGPVRFKVRRVRLASPRDFEKIIHESHPVILEGLCIGDCTKKWTINYLKQAVGIDKQVTVHEASAGQLDFQTKNFSYVVKPFGVFLDQISHAQGKQYQYMRSMASEQPAEQATRLIQDYPELAADFKLPPELERVSVHEHSSPLRISGPVTLWLHYDFPPGYTTSRLDAFARPPKVHPSLAHTHSYEASLSSGDVLFFPPLWAHTTSTTSGFSIGVNVFFRDLEKGYAAGRDVYANRDIQAYEKGRKDIDKMARAFQGIPVEMRRFYLERLADELRMKAKEN